MLQNTNKNDIVLMAFSKNFLEWKCPYFVTEVSYDSHINYVVSLASGNGLVTAWRQAITWANDDPVHWHIYALPGSVF